MTLSDRILYFFTSMFTQPEPDYAKAPSTLLANIEGCEIRLRADRVIDMIADADIDSDGGPDIDGDPYWQPETTLKYRGKSINAQTVPFAVIPIGILNKVKERGLGCKVRCTYKGISADGVLADLGPTRKVGEISPAMARLLGINPHSIRGGVDGKVVRYEIFLGVPAEIDGITYSLQALGG